VEWLVYVGVFFLVALTAGVTLLVLWLVWRNGFVRGWRHARKDAPCCPVCGYNLSGLTHCRCPECGKEYQLEQLWQTAPSTSARRREDRDAHRQES